MKFKEMNEASKVDQLTSKYRKSEFAKLDKKHTEVLARLKVIDDKGETKYLNITDNELAALINLLT